MTTAAVERRVALAAAHSQTADEILTTERTTWIWDGPASKFAWKAIGCKGKITLKGLRALP